MKTKSVNPKHFFFIILLYPVLYSCSDNEEILEKEEVLNQVVLIIDKCPDYSTTQNDSTGVWSSTDDGFEITAINSDLRKLTYAII